MSDVRCPKQSEYLHPPRAGFLPLIPELTMATDLMAEAVDSLIGGDRDRARSKLVEADIPAVRAFAAKIIGSTNPFIHRYPAKLQRPTNFILDLKPNGKPNDTAPPKVKADIYVRDGHRCRYCGVRVIRPEAITVLAGEFPELPELRTTRNKEQHAAFFAMKAVTDHVIPWSMGGRTDETNLVTSCQCCNYGKSCYLPTEIGFVDPWTRPPVIDVWDGLGRLVDWGRRHTSFD